MNPASATPALSEVERPRWVLRTAGLVLTLAGVAMLLLAVRKSAAADALFSALALLAPGWGGLAQGAVALVRAYKTTKQPPHLGSLLDRLQYWDPIEPAGISVARIVGAVAVELGILTGQLSEICKPTTHYNARQL